MLNALPIIRWADVKELYHVDYYDGPLTGMAEYLGKTYWFDLTQDDWIGDIEKRKFVLYEPTESQLNEYNHWNEEFKRYVKDGQRLQPESEWPKFYDKYKAFEFQPFTIEQARFVAVE